MNKNIISLTKVMIKNDLLGGIKLKRNKKSSLVGGIIALLILSIYIIGLISYFSFTLTNILISLNQSSLFFGLIILVTISFDFFSNLISIPQILYYGSDNVAYLSLPIKPREILISKLNVLFINNILIGLVVNLLPFCIYGYLTGQTFGFYIVSILVVIVLPILPITLAALINTPLLAYTQFAKNKKFIQYVVTLISLVFGFLIGLSSYLLGASFSSESNPLIGIITNSNYLLEQLSTFIPTFKYAIASMVSLNLLDIMLNIIILYGISMLIYVILIWLGDKLYLKGLLGMMFSSSNKQGKIKENKYQNSNVYLTYLIKEFKSYLSTPTFAIQAFLTPILLCGVALFLIFQIPEEIKILPLNDYSLYILIASLAFCCYGKLTTPSQFCINKDGASAVFMKQIPLKFSSQLLIKALVGMILGILVDIAVVSLIVIIFKIVLSTAILMYIANILFTIFINLILVIVQTISVKIHWSVEKQAASNGLAIIITLLLEATFGILVYFACRNLKANDVLIFSTIFDLVLILCIGICIKYINYKDLKLANKIY